ncbi:MAG: NTP transferase domain-containing protein [Gemmatimonadota bacterium]
MTNAVVDSPFRKTWMHDVSDHRQRIADAVVLAAGDGTRLTSHTPKQLLPLLGVPLLARTLFTLEEAGLETAHVVVGYQAEKIRREIERIGRLNIEVRWLYNDQWRKSNGLSALAAEAVLRGPFILTMADHLFDPAVVIALTENVHRLQGIDLAVDYRIDGVLDLEDATKVQVESDHIVAIGKALPTYDAIDTGVFLASPALFAALRASCEDGDAALSDGVQKLAAAGMARATDIGDRMWYDVDTPEDVAEAERRLMAGVRRSTDGPIARYINRPISTAVSRRVVRTSITPNQVSVAALVIGLVSAGFAAAGGYLSFLLSGILFQAASILDGTDGEVAKLTFRGSYRGEWVDTICDNIAYLAFLVGLIIGVHRSPLPDFYFWTGVLGLAAVFLSLANISFYLLRRGKSGSALAVRYGFQKGNGPLSRVLRVLQYLGKRDLMAAWVLLLAVVGQLPLVLPMAGIAATFLLLPATVRANLSSLRRARRDRQAPLLGARVDRPDWLVQAEPERARETAAG